MILQKSSYLLLFLWLSSCWAVAQSITRETVHFGYDKDFLTSHAKETITQLVSSVDIKNDHFQLRGHTDNHGNHIYNQDLSMRRCKSVRDYLVNRGVPKDHISFTGFAYDLPKATNSSDDGRATNRRVSIQVLPKGEQVGSEIGFDVPFTEMKVSNEEGFKKTFPSGTTIQFAPGTFETMEGELVEGEVALKFREFRDPLDFIASNIPMHHGEGQFHSGGMFEVGATQNGQQLRVAEGKSIDVNMAMSSTNDNYDFWQYNEETFSWENRNDITGGVVSWEEKTRVQEVPFNSQFKSILDESLTTKGGEIAINDEYCEMITERPIQGLEHAIKVVDESLILFKPGVYDVTSFYDRYKKMDYAGITKLDTSYSEEDKKLFNLSLEVAQTGDDRGGILKIKDATGRNKELNAWSKLDFTLVSLPANLASLLNQRYTDVRFSRAPLPDQLKIELKRPDGFTEIRVRVGNGKRKVVGKTSTSPERLNKKVQDQFVEYNELLASRSKAFNDSKKALNQARIDARTYFEMNISEDRMCFWQFMKPYLSNVEIKNGRREWYQWAFSNRYELRDRLDSLHLEYVEDKEQALAFRAEGFERVAAYERRIKEVADSIQLAKIMEQRKREAIRIEKMDDLMSDPLTAFASADSQGDAVAAISNTISLTGTGVFNADAVKSISDPLIVDATYFEFVGEEVFPQVAFVINSELNTVFKYDGYRGYSPYHMAISQRGENKILLVDEDGKVYYLSNENYAQQTQYPSKKYQLQVATLGGELKNKKQLEAELKKSELSGSVSMGF